MKKLLLIIALTITTTGFASVAPTGSTVTMIKNTTDQEIIVKVKTETQDPNTNKEVDDFDSVKIAPHGEFGLTQNLGNGDFNKFVYNVAGHYITDNNKEIPIATTFTDKKYCAHDSKDGRYSQLTIYLDKTRGPASTLRFRCDVTQQY